MGGRGETRAQGYVSWLQRESMLARAAEVAAQFPGSAGMSQNPFARSDPRAAVEKASVWFTAYPSSMMTKSGESFLGTLADEDLWQVFEVVGIEAVHTGPVKLAGGISGWDMTPSVDGHFDRIGIRDRRSIRHRGRVPHHVSRWPPRTAASSSTTSCLVTPGKGQTSGWPR